MEGFNPAADTVITVYALSSNKCVIFVHSKKHIG